MGGGEEAVREAVEAAGGNPSAVDDHEPGQVVTFATQAVGGPGSHAGAALQAGPAVEEVVRAGVLGELGGHRSDDAEFVGELRDVGEEIAHPGAGLTALLEGPGRLEDFADVVELGLFELTDRLARVLPVMLLEHRLVVEGIDLGNPAFHEEKDHVPGLGREVAVGEETGSGVGLLQEGGHGEAAEAEGGALENVAARLEGGESHRR